MIREKAAIADAQIPQNAASYTSASRSAYATAKAAEENYDQTKIAGIQVVKEDTKTRLSIEGMSCGMCEAHINEMIRRAVKVHSVKSSHKKGFTEIVSDEPLDRNKLMEIIEKTGYTVTDITESEYEKKGLFGRRWFLLLNGLITKPA